jgi:hypothetical protein
VKVPFDIADSFCTFSDIRLVALPLLATCQNYPVTNITNTGLDVLKLCDFRRNFIIYTSHHNSEIMEVKMSQTYNLNGDDNSLYRILVISWKVDPWNTKEMEV